MTRRKSSLLSATAAAALLAIPPTGAMAFDVVDAEWYDTVEKNIDVDITVDDTFVTTGVVEVEKLQLHFGDIEANATIYGVENNAAGDGDGDGTFLFDETVRLNTTYDDDPDPGGIDPAGPETSGDVNVELTGGFVDEGSDEMGVDIRVYGEVPFILDGVKEAIDLPKVENAATAVANNQQITSTVPTYLHDAQIGTGDINNLGCDPTAEGCVGGEPEALAWLISAGLLTLVDDELEGVNLHTDLALLTVFGAATGFLESADITANATVYDVNNATVENSATAVTNNMSVELAALTPNDAMMVADITQVGIADVTANATLLGNPCDGECGGDPAVELNGYVNFAEAGLGPLGNADGIQTPIVSNTATAVGNNLNISVSGPGAVID